MDARGDAADSAAAPSTVARLDGAPGAHAGVAGGSDRAGLAPPCAARLRLDEDLSPLLRASPRPIPSSPGPRDGAGRMMRSPTVFEDVVKTICTTNCAWSATVRMVSALVEHLGEPASRRRRPRRAFPTPDGDGRGSRALLPRRRARRLPRRRTSARSRARRLRRARSRGARTRPRSFRTTRSPRGCSRCRASARTRPRTS